MTDEELVETTPRRYQSSDWLKKQYNRNEKTVHEIADMCGVSSSTISRWLKRHGIAAMQQDYDLSDVEIPNQAPWKYPDLLRRLYHDKQMSTTDISHAFDCSSATVCNWMDSHGIETRDSTTAQETAHGSADFAKFSTNARGWESWVVRKDELFLHRLLAVAEYGFEAVCDKDIHHVNGIKWDNRISNIELVDNIEHQKKHKKVTGVDRLRIAEFYEIGDASSYVVADEVDQDITPGTVRAIHAEFYGGESA